MIRVVYASLAWLATSPAIALGKADAKGPLLTSPVGFGNMLQMVVGLLVVLGIIFAMAWLIRRMGHVQVRMQGVLKVLGGISIGQRERIVLVQVGEQQLLIGVAPGQIRTLHVLTTPVNTAANPTNPAEQTFAERLQAMLKNKQP